MSSSQDYAVSLKEYNDTINELSARTQQERQLHMFDLTDIYLDAAQNNLSPSKMRQLESLIGERAIYNDRKLVMDAADLTRQHQKMTSFLGSEASRTVLSGGYAHDTSRAMMKNMKTMAQRSNALHAVFQQKLAHDRTVHEHELNDVMNIVQGHPTANIVASMASERSGINASHDVHDSNAWAKFDMKIKHLLGGGKNARAVTEYGVNSTLKGGANSNQYRFSTNDASYLWQTSFGASGMV